jgi:hypothetical protein
MIAFERYVVIVKGLSAKPMTFTKVTLEILFVWIQALIWTLLPFFGWNRVSFQIEISCLIYYA